MRTPLLALLAALLPATLSAPAIAQDSTQQWLDNCAVYMKVVGGGQGGGDAEISYCIGQTEGIIQGLKLGSQIGALSFAGLVTLQAKLEEQAMFGLFQKTNPKALLGICMPDDTPTATQIETIYRWVEANPTNRRQPVTQVFYDALSAKWPCRTGNDGAPVKPVR